ncbi:HaeIII family restriction endonuclease [uncultured Duncaniella sp.]|uniref:HaeIII family restriction endonuclease n=1 Tax=uncultured Duncaniella sp. TaxID=2768039 RepID=UPI002637A6A1|nr:HaeIII family restriction endonuclease [uncultured Duncaniella sp.]
MSANSNNQGRAYEFICLQSLYSAIVAIRPVEIVRNSSYMAAKSAWASLDPNSQKLYELSAKSTIGVLFAMEPNIVEQTDDILKLYIQSDKHGEDADVRDIIIERSDIVWEVGLSIKHNHLAVKHSRLSKDIDFGEKWYGVKCSPQYWNDVNPVFSFLAEEKENGTYFRDLRSKEDEVYVPLLEAFIKEISTAIEKDASVPRKLVEYLLSKYDFYKVISLDTQRITAIQSFNMYGTLNKASRVKKPEIVVPRIELPKELLYIGFKKSSKTTVLICFDNGWQFSFRIHNAEDKVNTSLKFDIRIVGMPTDISLTIKCKW